MPISALRHWILLPHYYNAKRLGQVNYLSDEQVSQYVHHLPSNVAHSMDIQHPSEERAIRTEMVNIIRRAVIRA